MQSTNRFFLVSPAIYEQVRQSLDAQWGHPNGRADTCMVPAAQAVADTNGNVVAAVLTSMCEWPEVAAAIQQLTAAGLATEIDADAYFAMLPQGEI